MNIAVGEEDKIRDAVDRQRILAIAEEDKMRKAVDGSNIREYCSWGRRENIRGCRLTKYQQLPKKIK